MNTGTYVFNAMSGVWINLDAEVTMNCRLQVGGLASGPRRASVRALVRALVRARVRGARVCMRLCGRLCGRSRAHTPGAYSFDYHTG